jgi:hypothetical protein
LFLTDKGKGVLESAEGAFGAIGLVPAELLVDVLAAAL